MTEDQTKRSTTIDSRRTGLDRRWIQSDDFKPERRCGKDRRASRKHSFLEPIELNGQEANQPSFADIDFDPVVPDANQSPLAIVQKSSQRTPEVISEGDDPEQK